jgi:hypothetical protein
VGGIAEPVPSPCTRVCTLVAGRCIGCGRTLDEIARWATMSDGERTAIADRILRG